MQEEIYLAGGCFWGTESYLKKIPGVQDVMPGYANGRTENPTYEEVCRGSGHAETVQVRFDPAILPLPALLARFFRAIDPTSINRQGHDVGEQYRTAVFYTEDSQLPVIRQALQELQQAHIKPLAVQVEPLRAFTPAEEHHQRYLEKHPGGYCHIAPWLMAEAGRAIVPNQYPENPQRVEGLSPLAYAVTKEAATEAPFSSPLYKNQEPGIYVDATSGEPLFCTLDQYDAGCGWPSFTRPLDPAVLRYKPDHTLARPRTEVHSRGGGAHLGHVFADGPLEEGGLRFCINGAALRFIPYEKLEEEGLGYLRGLFG